MSSEPSVVVDSDALPRAIAWSLRLRVLVGSVGRSASFFIIPLILVTMFDVVQRKLIWIQIFLVQNVSTLFASTLLQELEWHFHTAMFTLVLGFGTVYNRHVRVDLIREKLAFRKQAWIEFVGTTLGMIPYLAIVIFFAFDFAYGSWAINEVGLQGHHRWFIKSVLCLGLVLALISGIAVWLQTAIVLFGPRDLRFQLMTLEWPEDVDARRLSLAEADAR